MKMDRYVEQLIEDIRNSESKADSRISEIVEYVDYFDYLPLEEDSNLHGVKLSDLVDIDRIFFPDRLLLNDNHITMLVNAIDKLWKAYGLNPVFPDELPDNIKYCQFRNYLNQVVYPVKGKMVDIELCDYLPHQCPFGELCPVAEKVSNRNMTA
jgi:hypothetical protein